MLKSATTYTYLETEQGPVQAHFFFPDGMQPGDRRTVVIFFHGGFWDNPMGTQFAPQCLHFSSRGAVAVAVETRVHAVHRTGAVEALEDAGTFFDWLAEHHTHFGIDPGRVVVAGAAGGALLALSRILPAVKKGQQPHTLAPAAAVLFSALLDPTERRALERFPDLRAAKAASPLKNLRRKLPPMIFFHSKSDRLTPFDHIRKFARSMRWRRNKVEVMDYENADHAFFNLNVSAMHYELTLEGADAFLVARGLLDPAPPADDY